MFRVAVAAIEASKPASDSLPRRVTVSSMVNPKVLAIGKVMAIEVRSFSKSRADWVVATAIVLTTRLISDESRLNARRAAPATSAASGSAAPVAAAKSSMALVEFRISVWLKPSLARLI